MIKKNKLCQHIGVLISKITNPFFACLVDALEVTTRKNGLDLLKKKIIDGLIFCTTESDSLEIEAYQKYGSILLCNISIDVSNLPVVRVDFQSEIYNAIHYLIEKGCRHITNSTCRSFQKKGMVAVEIMFF